MGFKSKICGVGALAKLVRESLRRFWLISSCRCFRVGRITEQDKNRTTQSQTMSDKFAKMKILSNTLSLME
jgi:hypothetical protein